MQAEAEVLLQAEVDESVTHRRERERAGRGDHGGELRHREQLGDRAHRERRRLLARGLLLAGVLDEEHEHRDAQDGEAEAHEEDRVEALRQAHEHAERDQRADHGAGGVERPVHAEGGARAGRRGAERDHGVAGRGADALPRPVDEDDRAEQAQERPTTRSPIRHTAESP